MIPFRWRSLFRIRLVQMAVFDYSCPSCAVLMKGTTSKWTSSKLQLPCHLQDKYQWLQKRLNNPYLNFLPFSRDSINFHRRGEPEQQLTHGRKMSFEQIKRLLHTTTCPPTSAVSNRLSCCALNVFVIRFESNEVRLGCPGMEKWQSA